jgi:hypothetical protein
MTRKVIANAQHQLWRSGKLRRGSRLIPEETALALFLQRTP